MPMLTVSAAPNGAEPFSGAKGRAGLGTISVNVLLHPEPFYNREDGQRAVEYPIERWKEPVVQCYRTAPKEARCYIEVEQDYYFAFDFSISNRSVVTSDGLKFAIFLDDHYVDYVFMEKDDCEMALFQDGSKQPAAWNRGVARCGRSNSKGNWYEQSFYFRPIRFVSEAPDLGIAMRQKKRAAGMGNLRVEVYRLVKGGRELGRKEVTENAVEYDDRFLTENLAIRRDFLNGRSATVCATLQGRMDSRAIDVGRDLHQIDGPLKPIAIFHFEYRTREVLKTLGYQPPTNVPALKIQPRQHNVDRPIAGRKGRGSKKPFRELKQGPAKRSFSSIVLRDGKVFFPSKGQQNFDRKRKREISPQRDAPAARRRAVDTITRSQGSIMWRTSQRGVSNAGQERSLLRNGPSAPIEIRPKHASAHGNQAK